MTINLDIEVGDIILTGKFRNKRTKVKSIGTDDLGQPTVNGKPLLNLRIEKLMPKEKQSKKTREALDEGFSVDRFKKLAGIIKEESEGERQRPARSKTTRKVPSHIQARWDKRAEERKSKDLNEDEKWVDDQQDYDESFDRDWHELFEIFNKAATGELSPEEAAKQVEQVLAKGVLVQADVKDLSKDEDIASRHAKQQARKAYKEALRRMGQVWNLVK